MSAPVLQTLFWELMVEAVNAWMVILQKTILHVKVGKIVLRLHGYLATCILISYSGVAAFICLLVVGVILAVSYSCLLTYFSGLFQISMSVKF